MDTDLDVYLKHFSNVKFIHLNSNAIHLEEVNKLSNLNGIALCNNQLKEIDDKILEKIEYLEVDYLEKKHVDFNQFKSLKHLRLKNYPFEEFKIDTELISLSIDKAPNIKKLNGVNTKSLIKLKLENITKLETIDLECTKLELFDIYDSKKITNLEEFLNRNIQDDIKDLNYNNLYIIGNLPYYITTPIITKIIESNLNVKEMVFMVQKEVAERFSAKPKSREYGSISVFLNYFFDIKNLFVVGKKCFYPVPNVDSAVIKLSKKENILDVDINKFSSFVKDCFQFKRKNLRNNLKKYDLVKIQNILIENGYSLDNRAEDLPFEVFIDIVNKY